MSSRINLSTVPGSASERPAALTPTGRRQNSDAGIIDHRRRPPLNRLSWGRADVRARVAIRPMRGAAPFDLSETESRSDPKKIKRKKKKKKKPNNTDRRPLLAR